MSTRFEQNPDNGDVTMEAATVGKQDLLMFGSFAVGAALEAVSENPVLDAAGIMLVAAGAVIGIRNILKDAKVLTRFQRFLKVSQEGGRNES